MPGSITFEWLEGGHFLVQRSHNDHELFPDAISVIGAPEAGEGLVMEYFDSRGVRRTYGVSLDDGVLRIWRDAPGFDQRYSATLGRDSFEGLWQLARNAGRLAGRPEGDLPPTRLAAQTRELTPQQRPRRHRRRDGVRVLRDLRSAQRR